MRASTVPVIAIALAATACRFPDKPGDRFVCSGDSLPDTAPDLIDITARVIDPLTVTPLPATITIVSAGVTVFDHVATDDDGVLTRQIMTGKAPHEASLQTSVGAPYTDSFVYPPTPIFSDVDTTIQMFSAQQLVQLGVTDGTTPAMIAVAVDCNDRPIEGATLSVSGQAGVRVAYITGGMPSATATSTDSTGAAFVIGLTTEDPVMVSAAFDDVEFLAHAVTPHMGAMTLTEVSP